ncbi:SH3 domain-containing protein [Mangrovicoccus algicola]|uniref:SH3 domain-containing protein n=1 Tax=Mangrovicoccus algicola TaxID=2771008 RepID=A0A8J6YPW3_9RHOB|nr:SH3 domain-containing protein [Mangrovicoccus algicola]MBE3637293.1 SH3 domain-containing protein [Mangrovicoccus algicola]
MRRTLLAAVAASLLGAAIAPVPAMAASMGRYEVAGVEGEDMLKMRAGPGTGYNVLLGLPNGTVLRVHSCQQTGPTRWCSVSLDRAREVSGYVSWAYLRKK